MDQDPPMMPDPLQEREVSNNADKDDVQKIREKYMSELANIKNKTFSIIVYWKKN